VAVTAGAAWFAWQQTREAPAEPIGAGTVAVPPEDASTVAAAPPGAASSGSPGVEATSPTPSSPPAAATRSAPAAPNTDGRSPLARRPAESPPPVADRKATAAPPADAPATDRVEATPAPPPAPPDAPAAEATAGDDIFKGLRLIRRDAPEVEVELHLSPTHVGITNIGGRHMLHALPYGMVTSAEYRESRHQRVFVRTTRHWLMLKGAGGRGVLLRLERDDVADILAAFEKRWGRKVTTMAPQDERP
jgi:hypothetical protein